jgi:CSLREA domain-containing protein
MKKYYNVLIFFAIIFFSLFLSNISNASASTLYFNGEVNSDWNNLGNWCLDSSLPCIVPAGVLPTQDDDVIVSSGIFSNTGLAPIVKTLNTNYATDIYISITVTNGATFNSSYYSGVFSGSATFDGWSVVVDTSIITGDVIFNNSSYNSGTINGNATFNNSSYNSGTINGNGTFFGNLSENTGTVSGIKTRYYNSDINIGRDFVSSGPWTIVADNATVNILHANIDIDNLSSTYTELILLNGGNFSSGLPYLTVNSLLDDGDGNCSLIKCTLRDAINNSQTGDVVEFTDLSGAIILNKNEGIYINHDLTIVGLGSSILTLDFNSRGSYIYHTNGILNISGLTFTNGLRPLEEDGAGTLNISEIKFINNMNDYSLNIIRSDGGVNLNKVEFNNNYEAIHIRSGNLNINNSTFYNGNGTAIYNQSSGNFYITNSTFANNSGVNSGFSGAIYVTDSNNFSISNSTFSDNFATNYGTLRSQAIVTNITNSTFSTTNLDQDYALYILGDSNIINSVFYSVKDNNCAPGGTYTSLGHNIESGSTCNFDQLGDLMNPAPYRTRISFNEANGSYPKGSLTLGTDGKFYGMTNQGGTNDKGVIFSYDSSSNIYSKKIDLSVAIGSAPVGSLILANDGKFYGMTSQGGASNKGVIFSYDPVITEGFPNGIYTKLYDFDGPSGASPMGSLVKDTDGTLYGLTYNGGLINAGVIFSYVIPTEEFINGIYTKKVEFDWNIANWLNGYQPWGSLTKAADGKFYGMTRFGGANDSGVIFSYEPGSTTFTKKITLGSGSYPYGSLTLGADNKLYGMTNGGGLNGNSYILSYDPSSDIYSKEVDLNDSALGSLVRYSDNKLYGMTDQGGIFSYDPEAPLGESYSNIYNLYYSNSNDSLTIGGDNKFYSMSYNGGTDDLGYIFSYDINPIQIVDPSTILDPLGLQDNGGLVKTIALLSGSPAVDAGISGEGIPITDARGMARLEVTDMGAFEYQGVIVPPTQTCSDGIKNQNETGIDTGGVCTPIVAPISSGGYSSSSVAITNLIKPIIITPPNQDNGCLEGYIFSIMTGNPCLNKSVSTPQTNFIDIAKNKNNLILNRVLKIKMKGPDVKLLQEYLNDHGYNCGIPDGVFGKKTKNSIILFQLDNGLKGDGAVGKLTIEKLVK